MVRAAVGCRARALCPALWVRKPHLPIRFMGERVARFGLPNPRRHSAPRGDQSRSERCRIDLIAIEIDEISIMKSSIGTKPAHKSRRSPGAERDSGNAPLLHRTSCSDLACRAMWSWPNGRKERAALTISPISAREDNAGHARTGRGRWSQVHTWFGLTVAESIAQQAVEKQPARAFERPTGSMKRDDAARARRDHTSPKT